MKLFGWGKKKEPTLQPLQQGKSADVRPSHGPEWLSASSLPGKGVTTGVHWVHGGSAPTFEDRLHRISKQQVIYGGGKSKNDKIQETIRFVFSHEQEGLLAIGTFDLNQLAGIRTTLDGLAHPNLPSPDQEQDSGFESCSPESILCNEFQISEDDERREPAGCGIGIHGREKSELSVFGDQDSEYNSETDATKIAEQDESDQSTTTTSNSQLTLARHAAGRTGQAPQHGSAAKPIVLLMALPPELKKELDPARNVLYKTPSQVLPRMEPHGPKDDPDYFSDKEYYSSRMCGLFSSKKKSIGDKNKRLSYSRSNKQIPVGNCVPDHKKTALVKAKPTYSANSIGKIAQLWRSTCKKSSAKVVPEKMLRQLAKEPPGIANWPKHDDAKSPSTSHFNDSCCFPRAKSTTGSGCMSTAAYHKKVDDSKEDDGVLATPNSPQFSDSCCFPRAQDRSGSGCMSAAHYTKLVDNSVEGEVSGIFDENGKWIRTDSEYVVLEM